jgi:membrane-associated phospholipid phosphatase
MLVYATVMIASTPIMGGHYFVDLIGGALLTVVAIAVDRYYADRVERIGGLRPYLAVQSGN